MTNREKFKETFGFKPDPCTCPLPVKVCPINGCNECTFMGWWKKEYKPCFVLAEEFEDEEV